MKLGSQGTQPLLGTGIGYHSLQHPVSIVTNPGFVMSASALNALTYNVRKPPYNIFETVGTVVLSFSLLLPSRLILVTTCVSPCRLSISMPLLFLPPLFSSFLSFLIFFSLFNKYYDLFAYSEGRSLFEHLVPPASTYILPIPLNTTTPPPLLYTPKPTQRAPLASLPQRENVLGGWMSSV